MNWVIIWLPYIYIYNIQNTKEAWKTVSIGTFPNPEIKALSLTQLNTSSGRQNI